MIQENSHADKRLAIKLYASAIFGRSCHKYHFCRDKDFVARDICRDKHVFIETKFCRGNQNTSFVATKVCLSRKNKRFVAAKIILVAAPASDTLQLPASDSVSCHKYHFCRDKDFVARDICRDKHVFIETKFCRGNQNTSFVATKVCLSRKKQTFCRSKNNTCGSARQ